jgi:hypothetical protein
VPHVDYLVEPGPEQIAFPDRLMLLGRIVSSNAAIESQLAGRRNRKPKTQDSGASDRQTLQSKTGRCAEN